MFLGNCLDFSGRSAEHRHTLLHTADHKTAGTDLRAVEEGHLMVDYSAGMHRCLIFYLNSPNACDMCVDPVEITDFRIMSDYCI